VCEQFENQFQVFWQVANPTIVSPGDEFAVWIGA
jgi:hypothetical protein